MRELSARATHHGLTVSAADSSLDKIVDELIRDYQSQREDDVEYDLLELSKIVKSHPVTEFGTGMLEMLLDIIMQATHKATLQNACCFLSRAIAAFNQESVASLVNPAIIGRIVAFIRESRDGIWWPAKLLGRVARLRVEHRDQILSVLPFDDMFRLLRESNENLWNASICVVIHRCCTFPVSDLTMLVEGLSARVRPDVRIEELCHVLGALTILSHTEAGRGITISDEVALHLAQFRTGKYEARACLRVLELCQSVNVYMLSPRTLTLMLRSPKRDECPMLSDVARCAMDIVAHILDSNPETVDAFRKQGIVAILCGNIHRASTVLKCRSLTLLCQFMEYATDTDVDAVLMNTMLGELFGMFNLDDLDLVPALMGLIQRIWAAGLRTPWKQELTLIQVNDTVMNTLEMLSLECPNREVAEWAAFMTREIQGLSEQTC